MIRFLGANGGMSPDLGTTCLMVTPHLLIDAGSGLERLPLNEQKKIHTVVLTHSHLDHHSHLAFLANNLVQDFSQPITVIGIRETIEALKSHIYNNVIWPDFSVIPEPERAVMRFKTQEVGKEFEIDGVRMVLIAVNHSVPAVGIWAERKTDQYRFAFTGDCFTNDNFWEQLNALPPVEDLIADCQYTENQSEIAKIAKHYFPTALAEDLRKLLYTPRIILSHLPAERREIVLNEAKKATPNYKILEASSFKESHT